MGHLPGPQWARVTLTWIFPRREVREQRAIAFVTGAQYARVPSSLHDPRARTTARVIDR